MRVAGGAGAEQPAEDPRAAGAGAGGGLEHQHGGPFADRHPLALGAEGPAGLGVDGAQRVEAGIGEPAERIAAAGDRDVDLAGAQRGEGVAHRERRRGAGRGDGLDRPVDAVGAADGLARRAGLLRGEPADAGGALRLAQ